MSLKVITPGMLLAVWIVASAPVLAQGSQEIAPPPDISQRSTKPRAHEDAGTVTLIQNAQPASPPVTNGKDAGSQGGDSAGPIDPQLRADILHLFDVMQLKAKSADSGRAMFETLRPTILATLPDTPNREKIADAYGQRISALMSSDEFVDRTTAVYARLLSDDDIKALTVFYQTPAGQHFNDVSGKLFEQSSQIGQRLVHEKLSHILRSLCADYPELQGVAIFCSEQEPESAPELETPTWLLPPASPGITTPESHDVSALNTQQ